MRSKRQLFGLMICVGNGQIAQEILLMVSNALERKDLRVVWTVDLDLISWKIPKKEITVRLTAELYYDDWTV